MSVGVSEQTTKLGHQYYIQCRLRTLHWGDAVQALLEFLTILFPKGLEYSLIKVIHLAISTTPDQIAQAVQRDLQQKTTLLEDMGNVDFLKELQNRNLSIY